MKERYPRKTPDLHTDLDNKPDERLMQSRRFSTRSSGDDDDFALGTSQDSNLSSSPQSTGSDTSDNPSSFQVITKPVPAHIRYR